MRGRSTRETILYLDRRQNAVINAVDERSASPDRPLIAPQ
jgi:hypothetical protein